MSIKITLPTHQAHDLNVKYSIRFVSTKRKKVKIKWQNELNANKISLRKVFIILVFNLFATIKVEMNIFIIFESRNKAFLILLSKLLICLVL